MKFLYYHTLRVLGTETSWAYNPPRYNQNAPKWEHRDGVHVTLSASYRNVKEYVSVNEINRSNRELTPRPQDEPFTNGTWETQRRNA
jgi:hypothetical protein